MAGILLLLGGTLAVILFILGVLIVLIAGALLFVLFSLLVPSPQHDAKMALAKRLMVAGVVLLIIRLAGALVLLVGAGLSVLIIAP